MFHPAIAKSLSKPLREVRDGLTELCTKVLLAYRKHCASTTSPGQVGAARITSRWNVAHPLFFAAHTAGVIQALPSLRSVFQQNKGHEGRSSCLRRPNLLHALDQVNGCCGCNGSALSQDDAYPYAVARRDATGRTRPSSTTALNEMLVCKDGATWSVPHP